MKVIGNPDPDRENPDPLTRENDTQRQITPIRCICRMARDYARNSVRLVILNYSYLSSAHRCTDRDDESAPYR